MKWGNEDVFTHFPCSTFQKVCPTATNQTASLLWHSLPTFTWGLVDPLRGKVLSFFFHSVRFHKVNNSNWICHHTLVLLVIMAEVTLPFKPHHYLWVSENVFIFLPFPSHCFCARCVSFCYWSDSNQTQHGCKLLTPAKLGSGHVCVTLFLALCPLRISYWDGAGGKRWSTIAAKRDRSSLYESSLWFFVMSQRVRIALQVKIPPSQVLVFASSQAWKVEMKHCLQQGFKLEPLCWRLQKSAQHNVSLRAAFFKIG